MVEETVLSKVCIININDMGVVYYVHKRMHRVVDLARARETRGAPRPTAAMMIQTDSFLVCVCVCV